ncbi:MAG: GDSL-type esterase/lipase family protein [Candidatus Bathyarchaeia archaeon]|jgi:lysophospholipase L1-like esterase
MNRKMKLLTLGVAILIVLLSVETYAWQIMGNGRSQADSIRVACVGDSITCGTAYPVDLWLMLSSNYVVGNFGVNGATVFLNSDNPYIYTPAFRVAKQFEPNIVIIMLGTNDANSDLNESNAVFINDYVRLVTQFQGLSTKPKVWIAEPPPIFSNSTGLSAECLVQNIIPDIEQVANNTGASVIDVYNPMINHSAYFPDGVHPDSDGSVAVAMVMYNALISQDSPNVTP